MLDFKYKVKTSEGILETGHVSANSKKSALSFLKEKNFYILSLEEVKKNVFQIRLSLKRISQKNIILFTKQLSIILKSKITIIEALEIIAIEIHDIELQKAVIDISEKVKAGSSFSSSLENHSKIFGEFYIGLIKIGERLGNLPDSLFILTKYLDDQRKFKSKIKAAMAYPIFLLTFMIFIVGVIFLYVFPVKLMPILEGFGGELPLVTTMVMSLVNFLVGSIIIILLVIVSLIIIISVFYKTIKGKYIIDRNILKLPFIGDLKKKFYMLQFAKNFSISVSSGLSVIEALKITLGVIPNVAYKKVILDIIKKVTAGSSLSSTIKHHPLFFSTFFVQMLLVSEKTGIQKEPLDSIADIYEEETREKIDLATKLVEPLIMIFLGGVVLVIVLAIFLPIIQMTVGQ